ncbi:Rieske 2Fe-2S domain-containing protein [Bacteroidales bacterium AH-315-I05]|nr:Rieske 2Fe-2S domain-containing protein [Bacteroidales bacterium AH-315-I05]
MGHDLSQCPVMKGVIECPLHGLQFNAKTGDLVPVEKRVEL